jgi:hypothetical protein
MQAEQACVKVIKAYPMKASIPTPFHLTLAGHGLDLTRGQTTTLQISVGLVCNQECATAT